jgi:hypothetical protein
MGFALNFAALEASLLVDALPKRGARGASSNSVARNRAPTSKTEDASKTSAAIEARAPTYPRSRFDANEGGAETPGSISAPASMDAGLRKRAASAVLKSESLACPVNATPARVSACFKANEAADRALARFHEVRDAPDSNGAVEGALRDVVFFSLAAAETCAVDAWEKAE